MGGESGHLNLGLGRSNAVDMKPGDDTALMLGAGDSTDRGE